jgi:cellulose biosynthesis protein BcsQ
MLIYAFWNNKGGTGKTSLTFQAVCRYAEKNADKRILVLDACPQANLSELLLGGLEGRGSSNLTMLQDATTRKTIAGYFQKRLPSPFNKPPINASDFISRAADFNQVIPANIDLLAGDALVELQANAIATLANTQIPGTDTWLAVIDWLRDFMDELGTVYDVAFIDTNPSFSIYTQIALATATHLVLPVMADDSSRRAIQNVFSLVYGLNLPSDLYQKFSFTAKLHGAKRKLPQVHLIAKNRLTQYTGSASAYRSVISSIDKLIQKVMGESPEVFSFEALDKGVVEVRDFQTTGVVAFAKGLPFSQLKTGVHWIQGRESQISRENVANCLQAVDEVVSHL